MWSYVFSNVYTFQGGEENGCLEHGGALPPTFALQVRYHLNTDFLFYYLKDKYGRKLRKDMDYD